MTPRTGRSTGLVDVLDRVLDKGLVVAGDIRVSLAEVELLTIRIRLVVCSLDKAQEVGLDWWRHDRYFSPANRQELVEENEELRAQLRQLEARMAALASPMASPMASPTAPPVASPVASPVARRAAVVPPADWPASPAEPSRPVRSKRKPRGK